MSQTHHSHGRKLRLALCLECPIDQRGGTEVLVRELIDGFAGRHELILVSNDEGSILESPHYRGKVQQHIRWNPDSGAVGARELARELKQSAVDIAHFHLGGTFGFNTRLAVASPIFQTSRAGVTCVSTNHGVFGTLDGYIGPQRSLAVKLALLPFAWLSRLLIISKVKWECAVSRSDLNALRHRFWPLRWKFRQIYHTRLRESDYKPGTSREKVVFCSGTIGARKAQPVLAEAFARLAGEFPEWRLVFVGRVSPDPNVAKLEATLRELPEGRGCWIQECSDEDLEDWYRRAEIFVLPSLHEGLGLSLQEALFHGCACVATRIGGMQDLIDEGENGLFALPGDVDSLVGILRRLMSNETLRHQFQSDAHTSVIRKGMTRERMLENYECLYHEALRA